MYLPALAFIADLALWWLASDIDTRWSDDTLTLMVVLFAVAMHIFGMTEFYKLIFSSDDEAGFTDEG